MKQTIFFGIFAICMGTNVIAQNISNNKKEIDELRLKLNEDGSHYLKFSFFGQLWFRYNQSNPGTTVLKSYSPQTFDIGIGD